MSTELLAMLGGGASGFLFKLIGTLVQNQAAVTEGLIKNKKHLTKVQMLLLRELMLLEPGQEEQLS